jgi:hypothetical protein
LYGRWDSPGAWQYRLLYAKAYVRWKYSTVYKIKIYIHELN